MASGIPYPTMSEDHALQVQVARYEEIVSMLEPGDVISEVESMIADIEDPRKHPLYILAQYYLNRGGTQTGQRSVLQEHIGEKYAELIRAAIDRMTAQYAGEE